MTNKIFCNSIFARIRIDFRTPHVVQRASETTVATYRFLIQRPTQTCLLSLIDEPHNSDFLALQLIIFLIRYLYANLVDTKPASLILGVAHTPQFATDINRQILL